MAKRAPGPVMSVGVRVILGTMLCVSGARAQDVPGSAVLPPPPPPPASAQPPSPGGDETTVVARDGAMFRGQLIEKVPGHYVTLRLSSGEHQKVAWWFIARIIEPSGETTLTGPTVRVHFTADDDRGTLQKLGQNGDWFDACVTPCRGSVSATGTYRVGGQGIRPSGSFKLPSGRDPVHVEAEVGTRGRTVGGAILAIGGGVVAYLGAMGFLIGGIAESASHSPSDDDAKDFQVVGGLMFLAGGAAGITGLVMLLNNDTEVRFPSGTAALSHSPKTSGRREVPSIKLSEQLWLSPRGVLF